MASHRQAFEALNTNVVTISFGIAYWARMWLQETQSPFPFLVDPERNAYHAYGLQSSILRSWMPQNLWFYAKATLQGREKFGKRGDPHQLGGDFIVDSQGIVRLAHPSKEPTDRPSVEKLLQVLNQ
ncbi:MAG: redoxin domain-containing protein, partial [Anaerolineae bacterium]|nr:redoxin domain-containing protein [Anaerolineae bacterium]